MKRSYFQTLARVLALAQSLVAVSFFLLGVWVLSFSRASLVNSGDRSTYTAGMLAGSMGLGSILIAALAALLALACFRVGNIRKDVGLLDKLVLAGSVAFAFVLAAFMTLLY